MSRPKRPLPPGNRVPRRAAEIGPALEVLGYEVASWCPDDHARAPAEQVHFLLKIDGLPTLILRLKSAAACDALIDALSRHRADVWPTVTG